MDIQLRIKYLTDASHPAYWTGNCSYSVYREQLPTTQHATIKPTLQWTMLYDISSVFTTLHSGTTAAWRPAGVVLLLLPALTSLCTTVPHLTGLRIERSISSLDTSRVECKIMCISGRYVSKVAAEGTRREKHWIPERCGGMKHYNFQAI